jgi:hypothetical protein
MQIYLLKQAGSHDMGSIKGIVEPSPVRPYKRTKYGMKPIEKEGSDRIFEEYWNNNDLKSKLLGLAKE